VVERKRKESKMAIVETFDSYDEFDTFVEKKVVTLEKEAVETKTKKRNTKKKQQVEQPVEITEDVAPIEE
jgi:hypothetical protein